MGCSFGFGFWDLWRLQSSHHARPKAPITTFCWLHTLQGMRSEVTAKFNGILGVQSTITRALVRCFVVIGNQCRGTVTHSNCHKNYVYIKCEHMKQKKMPNNL